jgi:uncharacterized protein YdhG (YjbR/CyaY superfamily)
MARTDFTSVAEYIRAQPKDVQPVLRRVRAIIRKAVPGAVEVISYQMPAYKIAEGPVLGLAAWKEHYSIYPASDERMAVFKGKRCIALAAEEGRSVAAFLTEKIEAVVEEGEAYLRARHRALEILDKGFDLGWTPPRSRDELRER